MRQQEYFIKMVWPGVNLAAALPPVTESDATGGMRL
jgi:hypothetical protein